MLPGVLAVYLSTMINDHTLGRFEPLGLGLVKPLHDYSFGNLPATLHYLLTGERTGALLPADCFGGAYPRPEKIVLLFIDSFGWHFWQRHAHRSRILTGVVERGILTPLSALFPSTTAASVTTLNLGVPPAEHAVYEWNMYVPAYGETIQSLAFQTLGDKAVPCESKGYDVRDMVAGNGTMHHRLAERGVRSIQLAHRSYANSPFNRIASAGAEIVRHGTLAEAMVQLRDVLGASTGKALISFYWAGLDTAAHIHGPDTPVHDAEVLAFWAALDILLADLRSANTLFLFTADHGQVRVPVQETIYINERWPQLQDWLAVSPKGNPIWPNGSPRNVFLHLRPDRIQAALDVLGHGLAGIAEVMPMADALAMGLFGPAPVSAELRRRIGDVLILPRSDAFVWWRQPGIMENRFHGHHGGLAPRELTTVIGIADAL